LEQLVENDPVHEPAQADAKKDPGARQVAW
jgi:hypothetical protein